DPAPHDLVVVHDVHPGRPPGAAASPRLRGVHAPTLRRPGGSPAVLPGSGPSALPPGADPGDDHTGGGDPMFVREVMTAAPVVVVPDTPVKAALMLLDEHGITSLPVVTDDG